MFLKPLLTWSSERLGSPRSNKIAGFEKIARAHFRALFDASLRHSVCVISKIARTSFKLQLVEEKLLTWNQIYAILSPSFKSFLRPAKLKTKKRLFEEPRIPWKWTELVSIWVFFKKFVWCFVMISVVLFQSSPTMYMGLAKSK